MSQPDVIELAQRLIRTPSINPGGTEAAVASVVQGMLAELGLPSAQVHALDQDRPNLLVTLDFGSGGRHLVLSGHLDTKPVGDATWSVDPWAANLDGDRLYGLGSADMKAAIAAMMVAAQRASQSGLQAGKLTLLFTADEEDGAAFGSHYVAEHAGLQADAVVIGEPGGIESDFDLLHLISRGIARVRLTASARQGHSSLSGRPGTRNAGVDIARAVTAIADELVLDVPDDINGVAGWAPTVNTALIYRGGVGYGVLPGTISADSEVRLLPGMRRDDVEASFVSVVDKVRASTGADLTVGFDSPPNDWLPATSVPADHPIVDAAASAWQSVFGRRPGLSVFPGTTDATWFAELAGIPTLPALGPGLLQRCHAADEWVSATAVRDAVELYGGLIREFCFSATGVRT